MLAVLVAAACAPTASPLSFATSRLALFPSAGPGRCPAHRNAEVPPRQGCAQYCLGPSRVRMRMDGTAAASAAPHLLACFSAVTLGLLGPVDISSLSHPLPLAPPAAWAAQQQLPDAEYARLAEVRGQLQDQKYAAAEATLTRSLDLWQKSDQPPLEIATILKDRSNARQLSDPQGALADLDAALKLYAEMSAEERPNDDVFAATFLRGQVLIEKGFQFKTFLAMKFTKQMLYYY